MMGCVQMVAFGFAPTGWLNCDGAEYQIKDYTALFSLIGTTFGGNGTTTFRVPDLRGRAPMHSGGGKQPGMTGGREAVGLEIEQMPAHNHPFMASTEQANSTTVTNNVVATGSSRGILPYVPTAGVPLTEMPEEATTNTGGNQPHENRQPYNTIRYCIDTLTPYPSRPMQEGAAEIEAPGASPYQPYVGQIKLFAFGKVPSGWAACQGQLLPIQQNTPLYSLLGTTYGGDGQTTFGLPDLRGRVPLGVGQGTGLSNYAMGNKGGEEKVTLQGLNLPMHWHDCHMALAAATTATPTGNLLAGMAQIFNSHGFDTTLNDAAIGPNPGGVAHQNMMPYLSLAYCIALQGTFPSRPEAE